MKGDGNEASDHVDAFGFLTACGVVSGFSTSMVLSKTIGEGFAGIGSRVLEDSNHQQRGSPLQIAEN